MTPSEKGQLTRKLKALSAHIDELIFAFKYSRFYLGNKVTAKMTQECIDEFSELWEKRYGKKCLTLPSLTEKEFYDRVTCESHGLTGTFILTSAAGNVTKTLWSGDKSLKNWKAFKDASMNAANDGNKQLFNRSYKVAKENK